MTAELEKLRIEFLFSVTEEVINELLCYLLVRSVLDTEEYDRIMKKTAITNKAKDLVDTVMSKGDEDINILCVHLKIKHPSLYEHIRQACRSAAELAELKKLRVKFVVSVTEEVINELLCYLLVRSVLDTEEYDRIMKKTAITNKARDLVDTVISKGDEDINILCVHLKIKHPSLYEHIRQACRSAAELAALDTAGSSTYEDIYPVTSDSIKNRVALLIINITFVDEKYNRRGAEKDEENMEKLLCTLGYEVVKRTNLTAKEMNDALVEFSKHPKLKQTDSVFVVISSHGLYGVVHGVNHKLDEPDELNVNDIYEKLNTKNCPALVNKPKIIIIQACRGSETGSVLMSNSVEADATAIRDTEQDDLRYRHKEMDFVCLYSSTPHTVSLRKKSEGSFLIWFIVEVFKTNLLEDHIEELFRKVMKKFKEASDLPNHLKQMPAKDRCTFTQHFFLFPKDLKQYYPVVDQQDQFPGPSTTSLLAQ